MLIHYFNYLYCIIYSFNLSFLLNILTSSFLTSYTIFCFILAIIGFISGYLYVLFYYPIGAFGGSIKNFFLNYSGNKHFISWALQTVAPSHFFGVFSYIFKKFYRLLAKLNLRLKLLALRPVFKGECKLESWVAYFLSI